jgi:hypothetical protein
MQEDEDMEARYQGHRWDGAMSDSDSEGEHEHKQQHEAAVSEAAFSRSHFQSSLFCITALFFLSSSFCR